MNYKFDSPAIFLIGPSAVGKTTLSLKISQNFPVEIISVDSAMVFQKMDIGTCKPSKEEQKSVQHHLIDIIEPHKNFNAGIYLDHVEKAVSTIEQKQKIPLFVGGTMMFHKLLLEGIHDFPSDSATRKEIDILRQEKGESALVHLLQELDSETFKTIDTKNSRRVERALEIIKITKTKLSLLKKEPLRKILNKEKSLLLGMTDDKAQLDINAESRIKKIISDGFIEELENLVTTYKLDSLSHSMNSINYKQFLPYLDGDLSLEQAASDALSATKKLIKTQMTWMKKFELNYVNNTSEENDSNLFSDTINTYLRSLNK